jgi:hypothetical protein
MAKIQADPSPNNIATLAQGFLNMSMSAKDQVEQKRLAAQAQETGRHNLATEATARIAATNQKAPSLTSLVDPTDSTKKITVDARVYKGGGIGAPGVVGAAESTTEKLSARDMQARESKFPQATAAVKGVETKATEFIRDLKALRDHPGLSSITGRVAGRMPGLSGDGAAAQALYDKILAKGGFQELQAMRNASPTGGALGNVSDQEGARLQASFAAVDRRQEAKDVKAAINTAIGDLEGATSRIKEAYDLTYEYKQGAGASGSWKDL